MVRAVLRLVLFAAPLAAPLALGAGCFNDPRAGETNSGETGGCPDGTAGCACYGNNTCNTDLLCEDGICKLPECVAGSLNCDCYQGECFSALVCTEGICKPEEAMAGCEAVADCDSDLCTQGDQTCEGACVAGVGVQCPIGATCDPSAGSCLCEPGSKPCGDVCIPDTQCCMDSDCPGASTCAEGFCTCNGGLMCDGNCLANAQCCPGEVTNLDCQCGAERSCDNEGNWSACGGGNENPECESGVIQNCGNCGDRTCTASCEWTPCEGEGICTPGDSECVMGMLSECTEGCFWLIGESC